MVTDQWMEKMLELFFATEDLVIPSPVTRDHIYCH